MTLALRATLLAAILLLLCFVTTGCTGSFNLTKKVYNWHRSQDDKWHDELLFLLVVFVPVYSIATFADAIVFNSIEFWTGDNPVEMTKVIKDGKNEAVMAYDPATKRITVSSATKDYPVLQLEKVDGTVRVSDENGKLIYATAMNDKGNIEVFNNNLDLVKNYSPEEVQQFKDKYLK